VLNLTFTREFPKDVRIANKSHRPIGDLKILKISTMSNGYLSALVGDFDIENKVITEFVSYIPAGARDRAASNETKRAPAIDHTTISINDTLTAKANELQFMPDDSQSFF
jgi:hypothetical protein